MFTRDCKTIESGTLNLNNLVPENIKQGVTIADVVGAFDGKRRHRFLGTLPKQNNNGYHAYELKDCPFYPEHILIVLRENRQENPKAYYYLYVISSTYPFNKLHPNNQGIMIGGAWPGPGYQYRSFQRKEKGFYIEFGAYDRDCNVYGVCFE